MRLYANTPIRKVISEVYDNRTKTKIGRPYHTWIHTIQNDLKTNISLSTNNKDSIIRTLPETEYNENKKYMNCACNINCERV